MSKAMELSGGDNKRLQQEAEHIALNRPLGLREYLAHVFFVLFRKNLEKEVQEQFFIIEEEKGIDGQQDDGRNRAQ